MAKNLGKVFWANIKKIDASDNKTRRRVVVVKEKNKNVHVAKVRGFNDNVKNNTRLYELNQEKYSLSKKSGVDKKTYSRRADNKKQLSLLDNEVFDKKPDFILSSHDTHRVLLHTGSIYNKKGRK